MGKKSISAQSSNSAVCFCCCFFVFLCFIYFASSYSRGVLRWALFVLSLSFSLAFYFRLLRTRRRRRFRVCVWEGRTTTYHALAHWLSGFHDLLLSPIVSHAHFFVFIWGKCVDNIFLIFFTKNQILFRDFPGGQEFFLCDFDASRNETQHLARANNFRVWPCRHYQNIPSGSQWFPIK